MFDPEFGIIGDGADAKGSHNLGPSSPPFFLRFLAYWEVLAVYLFAWSWFSGASVGEVLMFGGLYILMGSIGYSTARSEGLHPWAGFVVGFYLGIIGLVFLGFFSGLRASARHVR